MVLKLEKQNPKFKDYYCIYLDLLDQDPPKEVLTIPEFQGKLFSDHFKIEDKFKDVELKDLEKIATGAREFIFKSLKTMKKKLPFAEQLFSNTSVIFLKEFNEGNWKKLGERFKNIISEAEQQTFEQEVRR